MSNHLIKVSVSNGKYIVVMEEGGKLHALRYGAEWRDCVGDNLVFSLAAELQEARDALRVAARDIARPSDKLACHLGICSKEKCARCQRAKIIYDILDAIKESPGEHKEPHLTPLSEDSETKRGEDFYSPQFLSEEELMRARKMGNFDGSLTCYLRHIAAQDEKIKRLLKLLKQVNACMKSGRCIGCLAMMKEALSEQ